MSEKTILLHNAHVLVMDEALLQFNPGAVYVKGDSIADVGAEKDLLAKYPAAEKFDCAGKILMPGFVNTHTHLPMNLLKGFSDDLRLDVWLLGYIMPVEREFVNVDFVRLGTRMACAELIRTGVTCFNDMYYFEETVAEASAEAGLRGVCAQTIMKYPTPDAQSYEDSIAYTRSFLERWKDHPLIVPAVAPHAPYTCPPEILNACLKLAQEFNAPLHIHISETAEEVENMRRENGMPVVPYVKKQGVFETKATAAHCVHIDEGEIRTLQHAGVGIAHNPSSNLKLASGIAPVTKMLQLGVNVGIGTDGVASNNDLDFFEEIRLASFLAKGSSGDPTVLPAQKTLEMATRIGAAAIHMQHMIGSIEIGKRADLILIDLHTIHNSPHFRHDQFAPYAQIVYAGKATDVTDVMVNGNWIMLQQNLLTLNENDLMNESQILAKKMDEFILLQEQSVLSKLIVIGGASQEESFEVQIKVRFEQTESVIKALSHPEIRILRKRHYREYDTYFNFPECEQGRLRFREDHFVEEDGHVSNVRTRLTLIGPSREHKYPHQVLLSRSRYLASATQSLRFYREYFKPVGETEIEKGRMRYQVEFMGEEFFINIDNLTKPDLGGYLEIKSTTYSQKDAQEKSNKIRKLLSLLGAGSAAPEERDYIEIVESK